jgi:hypothetical protein
MIDPRKEALNTRGKSKSAVASAVAKKDAPSAPSPSPSEAKAIADAQERKAARRARIAVLAESDNGALRISPPHSDDAGFAIRLLDAFGTQSSAFTNRAMGRLGAVMRHKGSALPTQTEFNAALAAIDGIRPRDEIEAMLAVHRRRSAEPPPRISWGVPSLLTNGWSRHCPRRRHGQCR